MQNDLHKRCSKCGEVKPRDAYSLNKRNADGVQSCCKACMRQYRLDNPDRYQQYNLEYYAEHADAIRKQKRAYQQNNREQIKAKRKARYQASKRQRLAAHMPDTKEAGS